MELSPQFLPLFRRESYAIGVNLYSDADLKNQFETILRTRRLAAGTVWDKMYSIDPVGELGSRDEGEQIPEGNVAMGRTCYGSVAIEASVRIGLSDVMEEYSRRFASEPGVSPETGFAGYLADQYAQGITSRQMYKWHQLSARLFNYGAIAAGQVFYNHRTRTGNPDLPNSNLQYDARPLFAFANNAHTANSNGATVGPTGRPTGTICGWVGTAGAGIADTGGYFNAFTFPPSIWALKRVLTHYETNMAFDETNISYQQTPDTLLISAHNEADWHEILESHFLVGQTVLTENVFMLDRYRLKLVVSRELVANTWYLGKSNSPGIYLMVPDHEPNAWDFWYEAINRSWWMSYERRWGFLIRNWRYWVAGSASVDGITPPNYGFNDATWSANPVF